MEQYTYTFPLVTVCMMYIKQSGPLVFTLEWFFSVEQLFRFKSINFAIEFFIFIIQTLLRNNDLVIFND